MLIYGKHDHRGSSLRSFSSFSSTDKMQLLMMIEINCCKRVKLSLHSDGTASWLLQQTDNGCVDVDIIQWDFKKQTYKRRQKNEP